ncbi:unnamed protein product [Closterium sp. NIES-64]|nr:unnamed protein product [Closterium sp. NIES-64]
MASRVLVSGLPRSLPTLPPGTAPTCVPCVEGRQRAAPHSSEFPPTEAPQQTLHMDVWGPARIRGQGHERCFLLVVDDYSRYTTLFPLHRKGEVTEVSIDLIRAARLQLRESFGSDFPILRLHSDRDKLSSRAVPCVFLGFPPDAPGWQFYHPTSRRVLSSQDVDAVKPVEVAVDSGATRGAEHEGAGSGGAEPERAEPGGAGSGGAEFGGAEAGVAESGGAEPEGAGPARVESGGAGPGGSSGASYRWELLSSQEPREWLAWRWSRAAGAGGAAGARGSNAAGGARATGPGGARTGGTGAAGPGGASGAGAAGGAGAGGAAGVGAAGGTAGAGAPVGAGVGATGAACGTAGAGGTAGVGAHAGGAGAVPAGSGASSLPALAGPESDSLRAASPTVTRLLSTAITDPSFESTVASALVAELVDFAAHCRLDYAANLVAESESVCPPSIGGECALSTDVLEDRQEEFQCFAATFPHLVSMLVAPEGDLDAPDIPIPCSYAEAIEGPYSSQCQTAMDAEMASWKSTGTYVNEFLPPRANIVTGVWIFRVKQPAG